MGSLPRGENQTRANLNNHEVLTLIIATIIASTMAQNQEGGPQPDAEAGTRHFGGYGYNGYPLLGAGYNYPNYGYGYNYNYGHHGYGYGGYRPHGYGYGGYRPHGHYGYGSFFRNKKTN